jgi:hypothetical protein
MSKTYTFHAGEATVLACADAVELPKRLFSDGLACFNARRFGESGA